MRALQKIWQWVFGTRKPPERQGRKKKKNKRPFKRINKKDQTIDACAILGEGCTRPTGCEPLDPDSCRYITACDGFCVCGNCNLQGLKAKHKAQLECGLLDHPASDVRLDRYKCVLCQRVIAGGLFPTPYFDVFKTITNDENTHVWLTLHMFDGDRFFREINLRVSLIDNAEYVLGRILENAADYYPSSKDRAGYWEFSINPDIPPRANNTTDTYKAIFPVPYQPVFAYPFVLSCRRHSAQNKHFIGPIQNTPASELSLGLFRLRTRDCVRLTFVSH